MNINDMLMQHKDEILTYKNQGYINKDIANIFNVSASSMNRFLRQFQPSRIKIEQQKDEIIGDYLNGDNLRNMSQKYHHTEKDISKLLKENGVEIKKSTIVNRRYTLDKHYFDVIDTHRKAYFLGLLYADGCHVVTKHYIALSLQESDVDVLKIFNEEIKSNRPLGFHNYKKKNDNYNNQYCLCINNIEISDALLRNGLLPNKDFTLKFPSKNIINDEFMPSFLLGMSDGDGSIIKNEPRFNLTGNKEFIEGMKSYIESLLNIHCGISFCHNKESNTRSLRISGRKQVKKYLDYIYSCSDIYIERKHQLYINKYCLVDAA